MTTIITGFFLRERSSGWYFAAGDEGLMEPSLDVDPGVLSLPPCESFGTPELLGPATTIKALKKKWKGLAPFPAKELELVPVTLTIEIPDPAPRSGD